MTDNTQAELDELRRLLFKRTTNDWYYHVDTQEVPQASIYREAVESMLTRILDWHNKQTERLLDGMLVDVADPNASIDQAEMIELINLYINKLKGAEL